MNNDEKTLRQEYEIYLTVCGKNYTQEEVKHLNFEILELHYCNLLYNYIK